MTHVLLFLAAFLLWPVLSGKNKSPAARLPSPQFSVAAICVAIRDEHLDVHEWVSYHVAFVGLKRIYMFDFRSQPPLSSLIQPFIDNGTVVYEHHTYDIRPNDQTFAYRQVEIRVLECMLRFNVHVLPLFVRTQLAFSAPARDGSDNR